MQEKSYFFLKKCKFLRDWVQKMDFTSIESKSGAKVLLFAQKKGDKLSPTCRFVVAL